MGVGQRLAVLSRTESWSRRRHQSHPRRRRASPRRVALPNASPLRRCRCPLGGRCGWSRGWARRGDTALAMEAGRRSAPRQTEEPRAEAAPWAPSAQPQLRLGQRHLPQAAPQRLELCRRQSSQRAGASKASNTAVGETWLLGRRPRRPWRWRAMVALRGRSGQLAAHFSAKSSRGASARATAQKRARGPAARRLEAEYWAASCRWCTSHWKRCDRRRDAGTALALASAVCAAPPADGYCCPRRVCDGGCGGGRRCAAHVLLLPPLEGKWWAEKGGGGDLEARQQFADACAGTLSMAPSSSSSSQLSESLSDGSSDRTPDSF